MKFLTELEFGDVRIWVELLDLLVLLHCIFVLEIEFVNILICFLNSLLVFLILSIFLNNKLYKHQKCTIMISI